MDFLDLFDTKDTFGDFEVLRVSPLLFFDTKIGTFKKYTYILYSISL